MNLIKYILKENNTISNNEFYDIKDQIDNLYNDEHNDLYGKIREILFITTQLWENEKEYLTRGGYPIKIEQLKNIFPYSGIAYRTITFDLQMAKSFIEWRLTNAQKRKLWEPLDNYRMQTGIEKTKNLKNLFKELIELYFDEYKQDTPKEDLNIISWSKTLEGIKYFKDKKFGNHNVTLKGRIENGIDYEKMSEWLVMYYEKYYNRRVLIREIEPTRNVEEVLGFPKGNIQIEDIRLLKKRTKKSVNRTIYL